MEMGETVEGDSKKPWKTWKPNSDNPAEKPWLIWNSGAPGEAAGLRDERPHNAASFSFGEFLEGLDACFAAVLSDL